MRHETWGMRHEAWSMRHEAWGMRHEAWDTTVKPYQYRKQHSSCTKALNTFSCPSYVCHLFWYRGGGTTTSGRYGRGHAGDRQMGAGRGRATGSGIAGAGRATGGGIAAGRGHGGDTMSFSVCKFYVTQSCNRGDSCLWVVSLLCVSFGQGTGVSTGRFGCGGFLTLLKLDMIFIH